MLTVVGGVSYVSGALFGGVLVGVGLSALTGTSAGLGADIARPRADFVILGHLGALAIALTGIGVNRNPSGVVHAICHAYRPLRGARPWSPAELAPWALLVGLNLAGVHRRLELRPADHGGGLLPPGRRRAGHARAGADAPSRSSERARTGETPPELLGLDAPLTTDERLELDAGARARPRRRRRAGAGRVMPAVGTVHVSA